MKVSLVKIHKDASMPVRNLDRSSSKQPKGSSKQPKGSSKQPKGSSKQPKGSSNVLNSTKTPKSILKSKKKSMKSDGATPSSIESASYSRQATFGFYGTVAASIIWWWL
jgi:hypothetical protein